MCNIISTLRSGNHSGMLCIIFLSNIVISSLKKCEMSESFKVVVFLQGDKCLFQWNVHLMGCKVAVTVVRVKNLSSPDTQRSVALLLLNCGSILKKVCLCFVLGMWITKSHKGRKKRKKVCKTAPVEKLTLIWCLRCAVLSFTWPSLEKAAYRLCGFPLVHLIVKSILKSCIC